MQEMWEQGCEAKEINSLLESWIIMPDIVPTTKGKTREQIASRYEWKKFEIAILPPDLHQFLYSIAQRPKPWPGPKSQEAFKILYCD